MTWKTTPQPNNNSFNTLTSDGIGLGYFVKTHGGNYIAESSINNKKRVSRYFENPQEAKAWIEHMAENNKRGENYHYAKFSPITDETIEHIIYQSNGSIIVATDKREIIITGL